MLKRFTRDVLISIKMQPVSLLINIIGLGTAMSIFLISVLFIWSEIRMNRSFKQSEYIFRISRGDGTGHQGMPLHAGEILGGSIPEIESFCRISQMYGNHVIKMSDKPYMFENAMYVDSSFFRIFDVPFIYGSPENCLKNTFSMVITEEFSSKFFPGENPVGKVIRLDGKYDITISGVVADYKHKASITADAFISLYSLPYIQDSHDKWGNFSSYNYETFLLLKKSADLTSTVAKINTHFNEYGSRNSIQSLVENAFTLTPLNRIYFCKEIRPHFRKGDTGQLVILFSSVLIILLISVSNYVILTLLKWQSQISKYANRRIMGASRRYANMVLIFEVLIISILSAGFSIYVFRIIEKPFIMMTGKGDFLYMDKNVLLLILLLFAIIIGFVSALLFMSFFSGGKHIVSDMSGRNKPLTNKLIIKVLSGIQISGALIFLGCILMINRQLDYIRNYDTGYNKANILKIPIHDRSFTRHDALKSSLLSDKNISRVSFSYSELMANNIRWTFEIDGRDGELYVDYIDENFVGIFGLDINEGRNFIGEQDKGKIIINNIARQRYFSNYPVGSRIDCLQEGFDLIGVIDDVNFQSLYNDLAPMALVYRPDRTRFCNIEISGNDISSDIDHIERVWNTFFNNYPFEYSFQDDIIQKHYSKDSELGSLMEVLAMISIVIAILGVYNLSSSVIRGKRLELGIRNIYGASMQQLVLRLSYDINKVFLLALIPSFTITYLVMIRWLSTFAYHIDISELTIILSALIVWTVVNISSTVHVVRAARTNPVIVLRN